MRKLSIIVVSIVLAVVFINTAAAVAISGLPNGETIDRGETKTYTIAITEATPSVVHTLDMSGLDEFTVTIDGSPVATWPWSTTFNTASSTHTVVVTNNDAPNGLYQLEVIVDDGLAGGGWNQGSINVDINAIPEFPTIALPVAAILGLAFIFQRRREED